MSFVMTLASCCCWAPG